MNVTAVRSDGALLITAGGEAAVIVSDDGTWVTSSAAALARGSWDDPTGQEVVPADMRERIAGALLMRDSELDVEDTNTLVAATEARTGAMIALIPTDEDAERLAVDDGEAVDELHTTLFYLGEGADFSPDSRERLVELVSTYVRRLDPVDADGFAVAMFNPPGTVSDDGKQRLPCVVLQVGGDELDRVHEIVLAAVENYDVTDLPQQHSPWVPHVTLVYTEDADLTYFTDRTGPVTFDRVRVTFAGEVFDIPLGDEDEEGESDDVTAAGFDRERDVNAPGGGHNLRNYWVRGEGAARIGWGTDGSFARCVALLGEHVRNPQGLCAEYHKAATGEWPAEKGVESGGDVEGFDDTTVLYATDGDGDGGGGVMPWSVVRRGARFCVVKDSDRSEVGCHDTKAEALEQQRALYASEAEASAGGMHVTETKKGKCPPGHHRMPSGKCMPDEDMYDAFLESFESKTPYGDVPYADPGYQEDGRKRYPLDTEKHIRAAWSYINQPDNAAAYSSDELRKVKARIRAAMRRIGAEVSAATTTVTAGGARTANVEATASEEGLPPSAPWRGVLTVEGIESGDGRMFNVNSLRWDEPPLPLMWQKETSHGGSGDKSVRVGSIDRIWREPDEEGRADVSLIRGEGTIDLGSEDGREVFRRMGNGYMRGNSVDVDSVKGADVELVYPEVPSVAAETNDGARAAGDLLTAVFAEPELTVFHRGRIRASTLVEIPAFTEARLELVTDGTVTAAARSEAEVEAETEIDDVEDEGVTEESDVDDAVDEKTETSLTDAALAAVVAATSVIEISDAPPREWFEEPRDVTAHGALTITAEGRVFGYLAPAGVRHRSFAGREQYVPLRNVDYSRFHSGETVVTDGGRVPTGAITMGCGHESTAPHITASDAKDHYDNSCSLVATARVGENRHGVWIAGALLPDVTRQQVQRMMACKLSGDWRAHLDRSGWREFVAALLVPVPGFPMARTAPSVTVADGALLASAIPVELSVPSHGERVAAAIRKVRTARVRALRSRVGAFHGTHDQKSHGRQGGKVTSPGNISDVSDGKKSSTKTGDTVTDADWSALDKSRDQVSRGAVVAYAQDENEIDIRLVKGDGNAINLEEHNPDTDSWVVSEEDVDIERDLGRDLYWHRGAGFPGGDSVV